MLTGTGAPPLTTIDSLLNTYHSIIILICQYYYLAILYSPYSKGKEEQSHRYDDLRIYY